MWEPRIIVNLVVAQPAHGTQAGDATLLIKIEYTIRATRDERSLVYPFYLIPGE
jgi:hypothetical protein